jgi:hypothetical protein
MKAFVDENMLKEADVKTIAAKVVYDSDEPI